GKCVGSLCSADADCGATQVCRSGSCVDAPAATTVASCSVIPDYVVLKQGDKATFTATAQDAAKNPVVLKTGWTWSVASPSTAVTLGTMSGANADFTGAAATTAAEQAVKASAGGKDCFAKVLVLSNAAPAAN